RARVGGADARPPAVRASEPLPLRADALVRLHRPRSEDEAERARRRLALDELLTLQLAPGRRAAERGRFAGEPLAPPADLVSRYREALPFTLTAAQEHAIAEID